MGIKDIDKDELNDLNNNNNNDNIIVEKKEKENEEDMKNKIENTVNTDDKKIIHL